MSDLSDALARFRAAVNANDQAAGRALEDAYSAAWRNVGADLEKLTRRMEAAKAKGEPMGPSWLMREKRYKALQATIARELSLFSQRAGVFRGMANEGGVREAEAFLRSMGGQQAPTRAPEPIPHWGTIPEALNDLRRRFPDMEFDPNIAKGHPAKVIEGLREFARLQERFRAPMTGIEWNARQRISNAYIASKGRRGGIVLGGQSSAWSPKTETARERGLHDNTPAGTMRHEYGHVILGQLRDRMSPEAYQEWTALKEHFYAHPTSLSRYAATGMLPNELTAELFSAAMGSDVPDDPRLRRVRELLEEGLTVPRVANRPEAAGEAPGSTGVDVPTLGNASWWSVPPTGALRELAGALQGPVGRLLDAIPGDVAAIAREELLSGLALGRNPRRVAKLITAKAAGLALTRARTIARTEMLRAFRESARAGYVENDTALEGWVWLSAQDRRTCSYCWSQDGTLHKVTEVLESHPNCRCTMAPRTKSWGEIFGTGPADLGFPDVGLELSRRPTGPAVFGKLDPAAQRAILGPARYLMYHHHNVPIGAMWTHRDHPVWGRTPRPIPVRDLMLTEGIMALPGTRFAPKAPKPLAPVGASLAIPPDGFANIVDAEAWVRARFPGAKVVAIEGSWTEARQGDLLKGPDGWLLRDTTGKYVRGPARVVTYEPDMALITTQLRELDRLATRYPWATTRLDTLRIKRAGWSGSTYAHANDTLLEMNAAYTHRQRGSDGTITPARLAACLRSDMGGSKPFHPPLPDDQIDHSVLTHEFGHTVHFMLLREHRTLDGRTYDRTRTGEPGAPDYTDTIAYKWSRWVDSTKQTGGVVSEYARKSEFERVAEAFTAYQHQPREQWKPYVHKLAAILSEIEEALK